MIRSLFTIYNTGGAVSHICLSLMEYLGADPSGVEAWFPASDSKLTQSFIRNAYPRWAMPFLCRLPRAQNFLETSVERSFLRTLEIGDVAYLWPGVSLETYRRIKERGNVIVTERINCHSRIAKEILDEEFAKIGLPISHGITGETVQQEERELELADFIFAPNPLVVDSLLKCGVPRKKILATSYGWDPRRINRENPLPDQPERAEQNRQFKAHFVGTLCIRKGVHLLLESWAKAGVRGQILFSGLVAGDVTRLCSEHLNRPDVRLLGHVTDIGAVYRSSDVFVFPSLEEGGPLVTYEAMACGLPVIVSPMGAGPARDGIDGFIIDPHDTEAWAAAIRRLAEDPVLKKSMGEAARARAYEFTWEKVGAQRRELLSQALGFDPSIPPVHASSHIRHAQA